jgi:hypothetical protein
MWLMSKPSNDVSFMTANNSDCSPPFNPYFALISGVLAVSTEAIFARLALEIVHRFSVALLVSSIVIRSRIFLTVTGLRTPIRVA